MPNVTTSDHPLVALRTMVAWTREDAGRIAGLPASTVQNVELKKSRLSLDAARRIEAATGCRAESLIHGERPLRLDGEPYSRQVFESFQKICEALSEQDIAKAREALEFRLGLLLRVAGSRLPYVARRLDHALDDVLVELGIPSKALIDEARKSAQVEETKAMPVGKVVEALALVRVAVGTEIQFLGKWVESRGYGANAQCRVTIERFRSWPIMRMVNIPCYAASEHTALWRIVWPDGYPMEIPMINAQWSALVGKKPRIEDRQLSAVRRTRWIPETERRKPREPISGVPKEPASARLVSSKGRKSRRDGAQKARAAK